MTDHWRAEAACAGMDVNLFFPPSAAGQGQRWTETMWTPDAGFAVCADCPVRRECFDDAIRNHETEGVRGGVLMSSAMRKRRWKYRPDQAAHGSRARYVGGCRCEACREANAAHHRKHRAS